MTHPPAPVWRRTLLACAVALLLGGCAAWPRRWGPRPCCIEAKPVVRRQPIWWHLFDVTILEPIEQPFHLIRPGRKLLGVPVRALNLREGEVADSAFFTNRDPAHLSLQEMREGPTRPEDRAQPPVTVTKSKAEGKTAGFFVTDARGVRYLLKLDPVEAPELLSGAEVTTSKLLYALGYHVPSYEILTLRTEDLRLDPQATIRDLRGEPEPFTEAALQALVGPRLQEGRLRVVASKILEGEILGPARFKRFRDCADVRALKLAYAWVNNIDSKDHNSLLVWDGAQTVGYLIDFGTSLGADAGLGAPKHRCEGWTYAVDLKEATLELLTLGGHQPRCDLESPTINPTVGFFSARVDPDRWKPYAPNLAFQEMNADDARWMARRLARLSRAQIAAAVEAGQYSRPEDAAYLLETLEQRRWAIIHQYVKPHEIPEGTQP